MALDKKVLAKIRQQQLQAQAEQSAKLKRTLGYSQKEINAAYADMYDKISAAYQRAGDKFILLVGEIHHSRNSALTISMVSDIAHRLGIKNIVFECDANQLETRITLTQSDISILDEQIAKNAKVKGVIDKAQARRLQYAEELRATRGIKGSHVVDGRDNFLLLLPNLMGQGMKTHPGDPNFEKRGENFSEKTLRSDPAALDLIMSVREYENPMAEALHNAAPGSAVMGVYGIGHLPGIEAELKERFNVEPFVILAEPVPPNHIVPKRLELMKNYYTPPLAYDPDWKPNPETLLIMSEEASLAHRLKSGEITANKHKEASRALSRVSQAVGFNAR